MLDRDEYNKMIQTVQEIELAVGFKILEPFVNYGDDGHIHNCGLATNHGHAVFRQSKPFTDQVEYWVDVREYGKIVYAKFWE